MSESAEQLLEMLTERRARLTAELTTLMRDHAVAVAGVEARLEELRDLIGAITRKRPARKPKPVAETAVEASDLLTEAAP